MGAGGGHSFSKNSLNSCKQKTQEVTKLARTHARMNACTLVPPGYEAHMFWHV